MKNSSPIWQLDVNNRILLNGQTKILLTKIENIIVKSMLVREDRVISREELINNIGRDPDSYRGLEMSMSRLRSKFEKHFGEEHLFRSVRNRGYCLTQIVHLS